MRILIAEDERITRRSLQRQLEGWGHDVVAAEDGAVAWQEFQEHAFDIVVTDWDMPIMDGRELIQCIRGSGRSRYTYLIMLTGRSEKADLVTGMEAGADDFLAKPFDRNELRVRLSAGERIIQLEADRANDAFLTAQNSVANAREDYETALDEFKILIGMPTTNAIDVVEEGLDLPEPSVPEELAIETATRLRLDLLTNRDRVDDVRRGVEITRNNLLPDLDLSGSVSYGTNPDHQSAFHFREDDETWDVGVDLEIPLDRKAERNAYRFSIIGLRRAERGYDEALDRVRLEVRRARRQIDRAKFSKEIQLQNIRSNELRREQAQIRFEKGEISNQDIVDADDALLRARDEYDRDVSDFRGAILAFRLATGTLRVGEDGRWLD